MTTEERREQIEIIRSFPDLLEKTVAGLSEEDLETSYRKGGWTRRQVVHHVADSHLNGYTRMKLIVTEDRPTLKPYDQDAWAELSDSQLPLDPTLQLIRGLHTRWGAFLDAVEEEEWDRVADHPEDGEVTLEELLRIYAWHGGHHIRQIVSDVRVK